MAFFFCAFSPEKMPLALFISVSALRRCIDWRQSASERTNQLTQPLNSQILWLLTLFVATGVTATDFLCPALFMISKTLGLSQNIAGVTFLAFGNTSADIFAGKFKMLMPE